MFFGKYYSIWFCFFIQKSFYSIVSGKIPYLTDKKPFLKMLLLSNPLFISESYKKDTDNFSLFFNT